tara:strand:- start:81 stop:902 length:822 start_codon:yes stop_codon:yes gene_type:complete
MSFVLKISDPVKNYFKDVDPILEDPISSQELWESKPTIPIENYYTPHLILEMLDNTSKVLEILKNLKTFPWYKKARIVHSIKHLTLPEALVYYEILNNKNLKKHVKVTFRFIEKKDFILKFKLIIDLNTFIIQYDQKLLKVFIFQNKVKIGQLSYIIRNNKLEEITGLFKNKKLILDPVWKPKKRYDLKEEYLTIGNNRLSISYSKNEKHALIWNNAKKTSLKVKLDSKNFKDKNRKIVTKAVNLNNFNGNSKIIFIPGVLIPVYGDWEFKKK